MSLRAGAAGDRPAALVRGAEVARAGDVAVARSRRYGVRGRRRRARSTRCGSLGRRRACSGRSRCSRSSSRRRTRSRSRPEQPGAPDPLHGQVHSLPTHWQTPAGPHSLGQPGPGHGSGGVQARPTPRERLKVRRPRRSCASRANTREIGAPSRRSVSRASTQRDVDVAPDRFDRSAAGACAWTGASGSLEDPRRGAWPPRRARL